jgi:transposase
MSQKRKNLTSSEKAHIAGLYLSGNYSYEDIGRIYGRSKVAIGGVLRLFYEDPECKRRKGSGRPRKTTKYDDRHMLLEVKRNRYITHRRIKDNLGLDIHESTISRRLSESKAVESSWTKTNLGLVKTIASKE